MGNPVVHFEVIGKDGEKLRSYYSELFDWKIDADNEMNYGVINGDDNKSDSETPSIGGGVAGGPEGYEGHVTFYVEVPDVEAALAKAESLGGARVMGPETIMGRMVLGQFTDPEGHVIGLIGSLQAD
jgi:predicted enzyme related to lactoylglutathione lyase